MVGWPFTLPSCQVLCTVGGSPGPHPGHTTLDEMVINYCGGHQISNPPSSPLQKPSGKQWLLEDQQPLRGRAGSESRVVPPQSWAPATHLGAAGGLRLSPGSLPPGLGDPKGSKAFR